MRIIPRAEIGLKPPTRALIPDSLPWPELHGHHSVTSMGEAEVVRQIQRYHQGRGWRDGPYNFYITRSGAVIEGIGAGNRHLNSRAGISGTICWVGNLETSWMPEPMITATAWLIAHGALSGWWPLGITHGHRDFGATACPGQHAYYLIPEINRRAVAIIDALRGAAPLPVPPIPAPPKPGAPAPIPIAPPGGTCKVDLPVLRFGARGGPVRSLQALLIAKAGQDLGRAGADGVFGGDTETAVLNVQRFFGIKADGIVGRDTWGVMFL